MKGRESQFIKQYFPDFNAAALVDAARAYDQQLKKGAGAVPKLKNQ